jgi:hypothetical protein
MRRFALVVAASFSTWQCGNVAQPLVDASEPSEAEATWCSTPGPSTATTTS